MVWTVGLGILVQACGDERGGGPGEEGSGCHYDCLGAEECSKGVVTSYPHAPVPCELWTGECPHEETYRCVKGCRSDTDRLEGASLEPEIMCEENRPKQVGDVCAEESDCRPEVATWDPMGNVTNVYLSCDLTAGLCVAREPPVVPDWLMPCGLVPDDAPGYAYGVVASSLCSGGSCLFYEQDDCVEQGCTIACASDGECPPGSVCEPEWSVCKPGPPYSIGEDLVCPP